MTTIQDAITRHGVDIDPHLDWQARLPIATGLIRQGDIIVIPAIIAGPLDPARTPVGPQGHPVIRGEAGGNTHLLLAEGDVRFDPAPTGGTAVGVLTIAPGATALLAHPEHGYIGIAGPGTWVVRRQREQADEIRIVAD